MAGVAGLSICYFKCFFVPSFADYEEERELEREREREMERERARMAVVK